MLTSLLLQRPITTELLLIVMWITLELCALTMLHSSGALRATAAIVLAIILLILLIADMACYPWIVPHERRQQDLNEFPHLKRWFEAIAARPATIRAYDKAQSINSAPTIHTEAARKLLFGQDAHTVK